MSHAYDELSALSAKDEKDYLNTILAKYKPTNIIDGKKSYSVMLGKPPESIPDMELSSIISGLQDLAVHTVKSIKYKQGIVVIKLQ